jgi:hypothetical protein
MLRAICALSVLSALAEGLQQSEEKPVHLIRRDPSASEAAFLQGGPSPPAEDPSPSPPPEVDDTSIASGLTYDQLVKTTPGLAAFWPLDDLTGIRAEAHGPACGQDGGEEAGDDCAVDGDIEGLPTLHQESLLPAAAGHATERSIKFDGANGQQIVLPNHAMINTNETGYAEKTIELWFKAGHLGKHNRSIFEDGTKSHSGVAIWARDHPHDSADIDLFMYAWNRGNSGGSDDRPHSEYGTPNINPHALHCTLKKHVAYYTAFVFDQAHRKIQGYTKSAADNSDVTLCGEITDLPAGAVIAHAGGDDGGASVGGLKGTTRIDGGCLVGTAADSGCYMSTTDGEDHHFIGSIDNVAIYNVALGQGVMETHVAAAGPYPTV